MNLNKFLDVKPEVAEAIAAGKPVVALESTIISHGMPYPQNVETALKAPERPPSVPGPGPEAGAGGPDGQPGPGAGPVSWGLHPGAQQLHRRGHGGAAMPRLSRRAGRRAGGPV